MSALQKQIVELESRLKKALAALDLEARKSELIALEAKMAEPDFWQVQDQARQVAQHAADLKTELDNWGSIESEIDDLQAMFELAEKENDESVLADLAQTFTELERKFRALELETLFSGEYDSAGAIVSIHAGAGGTDAQDWTEMLLRMFTRFAESKNWRVDILDQSLGEEAGIKSVTFAIRGRFAYGYFRSEAGVHRLVRISPFDAERMRHTSFALVEVVPELDELSAKNLELDPKDLRVDTFMSSGHGGQSVNTTYSAVRVTHLPTGIVVSCQNERSQQQNKETALSVLKSRLFARMQAERAEKIEELRGGHQPAEWGNQIRSYVLHPYQLVKDHRTGYETQDIEAVLNGDLSGLMEAYLRAQLSKTQDQ